MDNTSKKLVSDILEKAKNSPKSKKHVLNEELPDLNQNKVPFEVVLQGPGVDSVQSVIKSSGKTATHPEKDPKRNAIKGARLDQSGVSSGATDNTDDDEDDEDTDSSDNLKESELDALLNQILDEELGEETEDADDLEEDSSEEDEIEDEDDEEEISEEDEEEFEDEELEEDLDEEALAELANEARTYNGKRTLSIVPNKDSNGGKKYNIVLKAEGSQDRVVASARTPSDALIKRRTIKPKLLKPVTHCEDVTTAVNNMLTEENLSEDFKNKASVLFEQVINARVEEIRQELENENDEAIALVKEELEDSIDKYLTYIAEEWMEENKLAVESGLKLEVAENLLSGLKTLFEDNYIEVPDAKVDLLDELQGQIEELEESLNQQIEKNVEILSENESFYRAIILDSVSENLSKNQKEQLAEMSEQISFENPERFEKKVKILFESVLDTPKQSKKINTDNFLNESVVTDSVDNSPEHIKNLASQMINGSFK